MQKQKRASSSGNYFSSLWDRLCKHVPAHKTVKWDHQYCHVIREKEAMRESSARVQTFFLFDAPLSSMKEIKMILNWQESSAFSTNKRRLYNQTIEREKGNTNDIDWEWEMSIFFLLTFIEQLFLQNEKFNCLYSRFSPDSIKKIFSGGKTRTNNSIVFAHHKSRSSILGWLPIKYPKIFSLVWSAMKRSDWIDLKLWFCSSAAISSVLIAFNNGWPWIKVLWAKRTWQRRTGESL